MYIVDENDNVSYVLDGKIYGTVELAKDIEPEESEEDKELSRFFTFNEETGAITGIVENTTKDANGIGWYYDGDNPQTANKIFSYKKDTLTIPKTINGKAVTSITQKGIAEDPNSDFSGNSETTIHLIIPEGITSIDGGTFASCDWINEVTLPSTLERIEDNTFGNCKNLKKVNFSSENKITYIGEGAFKHNCFEEINIPESVTELGRKCFSNSKLLNSIKLSAVLVGDGAFQYCEQLTDVQFNPTVRTIDAHAFGACTNLHNVILNEGLTRIESFVFEFCNNLKEIRIPLSVEYIREGHKNFEGAFTDCRNLEKIILKEGTSLVVPENKWGATNAQIIYE